jgi:large repetitive protein
VIAKAAVEASVQPGGTFTYRIGVRNDGPSTATGIVVTDTLPLPLTFVSSGLSGCTVAVTTVTCTHPSLARGVTGFFEFVVRLDASYAGDGSDLGNIASVSATTADPDLSNNTSAAAPPPAIAPASADLTITKAANEPSVTPGETFSYDIVVSNGGPSTATDIVVTDDLPAGLTFVSSTAGCTASGQLVTCPAIASLAPSTSSTITLVVRLDPAYTGDGSDLANTATATSPTDPTVPPSPPALPPTINDPSADVRIVKSVSAAAVAPGQPFTYTMTAINAGPSNAVNVVITDTLPSQLAFLTSTENCTAVDQSVTCPAVTLGVGESATFTVEVVLDPSYPGNGSDILNSSIVRADTDDPQMSNNTSPAGAPPVGAGFADVAIRKDVSPAPVTPGDTFSYTLTVSNQGPSTATDVVVTDPLPIGVNFVSSPDLCTNGGSGQVVTCPTIPTMVPGTSLTLTLVVQLDPSYGTSGTTNGSDIPNAAQVTAAVPDPVLGNNMSNSATPVVGTPSADLSITKSAIGANLVPGGEFMYQMIVTNNGPSTALGVEIHDTLPSQVRFVSSPFPSFCTATGQVLTCPPFGSLGAGGSLIYQVMVQLDPAYTGTGADVLNTATVESSTPDPDPADNQTPPVPAPPVGAASADISITKAILESSVVPGETFTYRIVVSNAGLSTARNVTITDTLPSQVTVEPSGECTASGSTLQCPMIDAILPGSSRTFDVIVRLDPSYVGDGSNVPNTASAAATTSDPVTPNVSQTVTPNVVAPSADLVIAKVALEPSVTPGETFTYRIGIRNDGPSTALAVGATDNLPGPLTFLSSALNACSATGSTVTCGPIASLAPGQTGFFEFVVRLDPAYTGDGSDLGNVATATSSTPDPNPNNNINPPAPPPTVTAPSADIVIIKSILPVAAVPGGVFGYELTVGNFGPSTARNVVVTDALPPQVTFFASPEGCTAVGRSVTCPAFDLSPLPVGSPVTFTIGVLLDPSYTGDGSDILNSAIVLADTADPAMANNSARLGSAPTNDARADLSIVKDVSSDPVTPGTTFGYTMLVTNQGPSTAHNVVVTDVLPLGVTFESSVDDCTATPLPGPQTVTCIGPAELIPGQGADFRLTVRLSESYTGNGSDIPNVATVDSEDDDPVPGNNTSDPATPIIGAANADVSIAKSVLEPNVAPGGTFTYRLVVSNAGPSTALGVVVTDPLPDVVAFVSSPQGCTATGQTITCPPIGSLEVGGSRTFDIVVQLDENYQGTGSDIINVASVTSSTTDPNPNNHETPPVAAPPVTPTGVDIAVTIASTASATVTGDVVTFTVTVTNNGPDDATGVVVLVPLPGELSLESATGPGNYDPTTGAWTIGALAKNTSATAQLQVRAVSASSLVITATKTGLDQVERNPLNDAAAIGLNLTGWSTFFTDLVLDGKTTPPAVAAGAVLGFELEAVNRGPTYVIDLYIEGDVPAGTTFVGVSPSPGAVCTTPAAGGTGKVTCKWPGATFLDPGAKRTMTLNVRVDPSAAPGSSISGTFLVSSLNQEYYDASNHLTLVSSVAAGSMTDLALSAVMQSEGATGTALAVPIGVSTPMRFTVRNVGSTPAAAARYAIEIPPSDILGVQVRGLRISQGAVGLTGISSAEWHIGPLAPGASATFDLTLAMHSMRATTVAMRRLESAPGDPNSDNDRAKLILDGSGSPEGGERYSAIGNVDGVGLREIVTGAGRHETPQVRIYTGTGADTGLQFYAYDRNFVGGVRVATCDVDGDGTDEIVTGPGVGPGPHVRVLRLQGQIVREIVGFYAFGPNFEGGVYVACGDVDNDNRADVIVGQGLGGSEVRVFTVGPSSVVQKAAFTAYEPSFTGGVRVAAVSTNEASGTQFQIVTAPGPGRGLEVRAWAVAGSTVSLARALPITGPEFPIGAFLDVADINADGRAEVVLATDRGVPALVGALTIDSGQFLGIFRPYAPTFLGGAHVALGDLDGNGQMELLLSPGVSGRPIVDTFTVSGGATFRFRITPIEVP